MMATEKLKQELAEAFLNMASEHSHDVIQRIHEDHGHEIGLTLDGHIEWSNPNIGMDDNRMDVRLASLSDLVGAVNEWTRDGVSYKKSKKDRSQLSALLRSLADVLDSRKWTPTR